jgi:hypothetical protein
MADHAALVAGKLRALVRDRAPSADPADFPGGAALVDGSSAWLLLDADPLASLGPSLVWADRRGVTALHLIVDGDAGVVARRASLFRDPPEVLEVDGTSLRPAIPGPIGDQPTPAQAPALAELLVDADLEVVVEDGIVRGEVMGLEVARIVHGSTTSGVPLEAPMLEVGVGQADRELTALVHGAMPPTEQLARVAEIVRQHRSPGVERHPLNQLAQERWLRARLVEHPSRIGLRSLRPAPPATPRPNLRDPAVAMAVGTDDSGAEVVVACSVGVLLDFVPAAADARAALAPDASLLLVVPERDAHPVTQALTERLLGAAELRTISGDWRL